MIERKNIKNLEVKELDSIFYRNMCADKIKLSEIKSFVARKQLEKMQIAIIKRLDEIYLTISKGPSLLNVESNILMELGKLKTLYYILEAISLSNLKECINIIDTCNIILNGEENCDMIISKATEDELQIHAYQLMKQFEEENGPIEFDFQKRK